MSVILKLRQLAQRCDLLLGRSVYRGTLRSTELETLHSDLSKALEEICTPQGFEIKTDKNRYDQKQINRGSKFISIPSGINSPSDSGLKR